MEYGYSREIRDDNTPEHAKYPRYLDAKGPYPDVQYKSLKIFARRLLEGERDALNTFCWSRLRPQQRLD